MDKRATKLAEIIVNHSVKVTRGSNVIIDISDFSAKDLAHECYRLSLEKGANVYLDVFGTNYEIGRADYGGFLNTMLKVSNKTQLTTPKEIMEAKIAWGDKFIRITSIHNKNFLEKADPEKLRMYSSTYYPTFEKMIKKDWLLTYFPTIGMAQNAKMSLEEFKDFYYKATIVDYKEMNKKNKKLIKILDAGSEVHITAKGTDLKFGIKGRFFAGGDSGIYNIPDGEVFTGPQETKTEGYVTFEYPQIYNGKEVTGIKLEYKKGRIVNYSCDTGKKHLDQLLNDHEDNMRLGELGIGTNSKIKNYIKDILFDEKIYGTVHMALGRSYEDKKGGGKNGGTIHWDMIKDLRHKGSLVSVDGKPLIVDGKFIV